MTRLLLIILAIFTMPLSAGILPHRPGVTVFVDSVAGSDANSGRAVTLPKQTLAAAVAICGANEVIGLKAGSHWRESLNVVNLSSPSIVRYGVGAAPIVSGADLHNGGWTLTSGVVWQKSVSHNTSGNDRLTVYEDGVLLTRVADVAACQAAAGSFVKVLASQGSPLTVYVHATGDGQPGANGKSYEITVRATGIIGGNNVTVRGVQTEKVVGNNGSLDCLNHTGVHVSRVLAVNGTKHNYTVGAGITEDCIAILNDPVITEEQANAPVTNFMNDGTGLSASLRRCGIVDCLGAGFYAHGSPNNFDAIRLEQCWQIGSNLYAGGVGHVGSLFRETTIIPGEPQSLCMTFITDPASSTNLYGERSDSVFCIDETSAFSGVMSNTGSTFTRCVLYSPDAAGISWITNGTSQPMVVNNSVIYNSTNSIQTTGDFTGNYNVYMGGTTFGNGSVFYNQDATSGNRGSLGAWQANNGGQDSYSVYLLQADQTAGNANAFWLGVSSNTNNGPVDGDFRINPNARVYGAPFTGSTPTTYTGTFADGTTVITLAGPQTHWDWNTRTSTSGPPTAWPEPPDTLAESQTYIAAPEAWNFYP